MRLTSGFVQRTSTTIKLTTMKNTYLLTYSYRQGKFVKTGKMQIKNCDNELHAKIRLDNYLKRKIGDGVLEVSECEEYEDMVGYLRSIFGMK